MTRILAIDPSLTATGVAYLDTDDYLVIDAWTDTSKPAGDDPTARNRRIVGIAAEVMGSVDEFDLLVIESPAYNSRDGHQHDRSGLWWTLVGIAVARGKPVVEVVPQHIKKYATGKGNAAKEDVLLAVERRWPHAKVSNNNEADAVVLAAIAARGLGVPIDPYAKHRVDVARVLPWPAGLIQPACGHVCDCTSDDECGHFDCDCQDGPR